MQALRTIYRYWIALVLLAVLVQIGAAGYGAFYAADKSDPGPLTKHGFDHGFNFHDGFGYVIFYAAIVAFGLVVLSRAPRREVLRIAGLPLLIAAQIALAAGGESVPVIGIFHPLVAFAIAGFAGRLTFEAWWGARRAPAPAG